MDHIPLPGAPNEGHIVVLLRENDFYSYLYTPPWHSYPERQGYDIAEFYSFMGNTLPERFKSSLASFVQSWLYFGLLAEFLGGTFDVNDWIRDREDGTKVVSTALLLNRLAIWRRQALDALEMERLRMQSELDSLLDKAHKFHSIMSLGTDFRSTSNLLPPDLSISIHVLLATLIVARNSVFPGIPKRIPTHGIFEVLSNQFRVNGWCVSEVARLRQDTSILGEYYASRLGQLPQIRDHSLCSEEVCFAAQINTKTYQTQHISTACDCKFVGPETSHLAKVLMTNDNPLVTIDAGGEDAEVELLLEQDSATAYVAISHVWADGLGNPSTNKLPLCQVRRIQHQVDALYGANGSTSKPFWIDTMCIPVGEEFREQRNKAIAGMVNIYRSADKVLIINKELLQINSSRQMMELAMRASRTQWFRRLWTLNESVLSHDLYFQFKDRAVSMKRILDSCMNTETLVNNDFRLQDVVLREACAPMLRINAFKEVPNDQRIRYIWTALQWRTTSNPEDETICLVNMLGLKLDTILKIPRNSPAVATERMKAFIRLQRYFPPNSLFESPKTRGDSNVQLDVDGYRWAPKSFVFRTALSGASPGDKPLAVADENGLLVSFPGLRMNWADIAEGVEAIAFTIAQEWDHWYSVSWLTEDTRAWSIDANLKVGSWPAIILEKDIATIGSKGKSGMSFSHDAMMAGDINAFTLDVFLEACDGAFVVVSREEGGVLKGSLRGRVIVQKRQFSTTSRPAWEQIDSLARDNVNGQADLRCFEMISSTQNWCIG